MPSETVLLDGHIIDSLILAKVLDTIIQMGGTFDLTEVQIGSTRETPSHTTIHIHADSASQLENIIQAIQPHGATIAQELDCTLTPSPADGILPEMFYATSHLPTHIRVNARWIEVEGIEMDLAIRVTKNPLTANTIPMGQVKQGDLIVTGRHGIRVFPLERPQERDTFGFMEAQTSPERPHRHTIVDVARRMLAMRTPSFHSKTQNDHHIKYMKHSNNVLFVGGPAIVHSGGRDALSWLIESGFIHTLFCGNALAAHDMEASLYGTSLGYNLCAGHTVPHGHEHHLRTINRIRHIGSIREAVQTGVIRNGIMASCIRQDIPMVLAGSIRDDGPLPEVITDVIEAQKAMRAVIPGTGLVLLVATTLHAIATGNLLPAHIPTICVDINPAVVTKLSDRGSFQAVGLVMDAASFLCQLARELGWDR